MMNLCHRVFICMAFCLYCGAADWAPHCCLKTPNKRISFNRLRNYTIQTAGLCPINAIIFTTVKGRKLCNNPDLDWVKQAMKKIRDDQMKEKNTGSSSASATSTKPKNGRRKSNKGKTKGKGKNQKKKVK